VRAIVAGVVATLAVTCGSALASAQHAWIAKTCGEPPLVQHPKTIGISCDSHLVLTHLRWTNWGDTATTATGTLDVSEGCPTSGCAAPVVYKYAVNVRASKIVVCPGDQRTYKRVVAKILRGADVDGKRTFTDPLGSCDLAG
jgi:hypothetical protein